MTIHRYTGQPLSPGMIVCPVSMMTAGLCGTPRIIERVTAQSVVLRDIRSGEESTKRLSSIAFVCDTESDGWRAHGASTELCASEQLVEQQQLSERAERKRLAIAALEG